MTPRDAARADLELAPIVRGPRKCEVSRPSWEHARISRMRADHDRVPKAELEEELRLSRLANDGQQSEAARLLGVTEGCLRHWRKKGNDSLPPRWAIEELRRKRQEASQNRRLAG